MRLSERALVTDADVAAGYAVDSSMADDVPDHFTVVRARDVGDVVEVLRHAAAERVPVVPQGARTGLAGGASATEGCIVLNVEALDTITEIDEVERFAVVQAGVVTADLAVDPSAQLITDGGGYRWATDVTGRIGTTTTSVSVSAIDGADKSWALLIIYNVPRAPGDPYRQVTYREGFTKVDSTRSEAVDFTGLVPVGPGASATLRVAAAVRPLRQLLRR